MTAIEDSRISPLLHKIGRIITHTRTDCISISVLSQYSTGQIGGRKDLLKGNIKYCAIAAHVRRHFTIPFFNSLFL